ncbi:MAG: CopD family protein [Pseudomonadota bacterium]
MWAPGIWESLSLTCKLLIYASTAGAIGGTFSARLFAHHRDMQDSIRRYIRWSCVAGLAGSVFFFFFQVGAVADLGWRGMFDVDLIGILIQTSNGSSAFTRSAGYAMIGLGAVGSFPTSKFYRITPSNCLIVGGIVILLTSFTTTGHLANADALVQLALALHVLTVSLWIGSLYPLLSFSQREELSSIQQVMHTFGKVANWIVLLLLSCGLLLSWLLLEGVSDLVTTDYGRGLGVKILLVVALLLMAARNKLRLTPAIFQPGVATKLALAIRIEILIALLILLTTAIITVIIGTEAIV